MKTLPVKPANLTAVLLGILVLIALGGVLYVLRGVILPFLVAIFLAQLLDPVIRALTRLHFPHAVATTLALLTMSILLVLTSVLLYAGALSFAKGFPIYEPKLRSLVTLLISYAKFAPQEWRLADLGAQLAGTSVANAMLSSLGSFVALAGHLLLIFIFMVFLLVGQRHMPTRIRRAFEADRAQHINDILERITQQMQTYLGTKALISFVTGILVHLILMLFDIDFAILWAVLAFMLNFIPSVGSSLAAIPPILIALLKFDSPMPAVWVAVCLTIINVTLGGVVEPRLMGQRLDLSPLLVIISLLFWGWLWGITGMALAVPIMVTIKIICENIPTLHFVSILMSSE